MVDEAQAQLHSVRYAALAGLLEKSRLDPDPTQPALRQFGTYLTARNGHGPHNGASVTNGKKKAGPTAGSFMAELQQETDRVRQATAALADGLWLELLKVAEALPASSDPLEPEFIAERRVQKARAKCDAIGASLTVMDGFVRVAVAQLAQLAEMRDTGRDMGPPPTEETAGEDSGPVASPLYLASFQACVLADTRLEPILVGLSDVYENLRSLQAGSSSLDTTDTTWQPPTRFTRDVTKFWLRPRDAMRFKCEMIKHMPVLIFGPRQKLGPGKRSAPLGFLQQQSVSDWTTVNSVYYDDREMQTYLARLRRDDQASVVRVRWYGQRTCAANQQLFVERKVHREPWTGETSNKERAAMEQQHLLPFVTGEALPPMLDPAGTEVNFLLEVQDQLREWNQEPMLRTVCDRIAFQEATNDFVRVSLDTHLHMVSEMDAPRCPGDWCRDSRAAVLPEEVVHFPYCIVEMKMRLETPPAWLQSMVSSGMLLLAPRFSKYLHGAAGLFPNVVEKMPYWYLCNTDGTMSPATWEELADDADRFYEENAAPWLFPKRNEVPLLGRLSGLLRPNPAQENGSVASEGKDAEGVAEPRAGRAEQAGTETQAVYLGQGAGGNAASPTPGHAQQHLLKGQDLGLPAAEIVPTAERDRGRVASRESHRASPAGTLQSPGNTTQVVAQAEVKEAEAKAGWLAAKDRIPPDRAATEPVAAPVCAPPAGLPRVPPPVPDSLLHSVERDLDPVPQPGQQPATFHQVDIEAPALLEGQETVQPRANSDPQGSSPRAWWTLPLTAGRGQPPSGQDNCASAPAADESQKPKLTQASYRSKALVRSRVEPKTFFANERTFLNWLHISVLIMLTGLSLLGSNALGGKDSAACTSPSPPPPPHAKHASAPGTSHQPPPPPAASTYSSFRCNASQYAGLALAPVAVLFMIYALYMYKKRTIQIMQQRKSVRYDDQRGPVLLVVLLVGATLAAMIITAKAAFS